MLPVFSGVKYGYCYETETGHYLLHDKEHKTHIYLQGDDARIFREQMEIEDLEMPEYPENLRVIENIISIYL